MHGIFINYRREDSAGYARSLFDRLASHFGPELVFIDVMDIEPGLDFVEAIEKSLESCDALVVLIGNQWTEVSDIDGAPRLQDSNDYVRIEIARALARNVRVIPVLIRGAVMPGQDRLPEELQPLARRQALPLSDDRYDHDVERLIATLEKALGPKFKPRATAASAPEKKRKRWPLGWIAAAGGLAMAAILTIPVIEDDADSSVPVAGELDGINLAQTSPAKSTGQDLERPRAAATDVGGPAAALDTSYPPALIREVQQALQADGYATGGADGVLGRQTLLAIREFQEDIGETADGILDDELIQQIRASAATPAVPRNLAATGAADSSWSNQAGTRDLTDIWYDDFGNPIQITQSGNQVTSRQFDSAGAVIGTSEGTFDGRTLSYRWASSSDSGQGYGYLEPDGIHMTIQLTSATTGAVENNRLHRDHRPSNNATNTLRQLLFQ